MRDVVQMEAEVEQKAGEPAGSFARTLAGIVLEQTLVFPTAVVLLASATVLLGGSCAVWQWWASVALTLAWPFWKNRWRAAAAGGGGFLLVLFAVWAVSGITVTREWWDCHSYHYPAMRMLMLGWNPVWESTREAIEAACGQASGLNIWPVLSMPRSVWYFSAVAAFFTKNQFNFYHPVVLFFLFSGIGYAWKALGKTNVFVKLVAAVFVVSVSQVYPHALDMTMALAALGLFACQYSYLRGQAWQTVPLVCFSFWMCSAKQPGIAFCAIAWLAFGAVVLCLEWRERKRALLRFAKAGGIAAGLFLVANVSPYLTSFVHYGHPLYPQFTADAAKYPRVNFTADFLEVNDDARAMLSSKTAMFLNAYVSPDLVKGFYEWSLDKPGFRPRGQTWKQGGGKDGWDTPLNDASRYWVMIPIVLLIVFGGLAERFVAGVMLLCAIAVPTEMIGLLRYVSMNQFAVVFCLPMLWRLAGRRLLARIACAAAFAFVGWTRLCAVAKAELESVDDRLVIYDCFTRGLPETLYYNKFVQNHKVQASLDLMQRLVPRMAGARLVPIPDEMYKGATGIDLVSRASMTRKLDQEYPRLPDWSFRLPKWYGPEKLSAARRIRAGEARPRGAWAGALYEFKVFWKCFAADVPRAVWLLLSGKMNSHMAAAGGSMTRASASADAASAMLGGWGINVAYDRHAGARARVCGASGQKMFYPKWLLRDGAQGLAVEGSGMSGTCTLTFHGAGEVVFCLKGVCVPVRESTYAAVYADFESFRVNGREMLAGPVQVCHTKTHRVSLHVDDGDVLNVAVRLKPHRYAYDELRQILLDAADVTFATDEEVGEVMSAPGVRRHLLGGADGGMNAE